MDDEQLLKEFVEHRSQAAFALLVERHLPFVYSTCRREVHDTALAEDVTQVVFLLLAKKAPTLRPGTVLSGWLYNAARFAARDALKRELRRQRRDHKAAQEMREPTELTSDMTNEDAAWRDLEPLLHDALAVLGEEERNAVLLRFFQGQSLRDTGVALGISEDAARMRITRAVNKLKKFFLSRGFGVSGPALALLLGENAVQAAPAGCATAVLQAAQCVTAGGCTSTVVSAKVLSTLDGTVRAMLLAKAKSVALTCVSMSLVGTAGAQAVRSRFAPTSSSFHSGIPKTDSLAPANALVARHVSMETSQRPSVPKSAAPAKRPPFPLPSSQSATRPSQAPVLRASLPTRTRRGKEASQSLNSVEETLAETRLAETRLAEAGLAKPLQPTRLQPTRPRSPRLVQVPSSPQVPIFKSATVTPTGQIEKAPSEAARVQSIAPSFVPAALTPPDAADQKRFEANANPGASDLAVDSGALLPRPLPHQSRVVGRVVDAAGHPVVGARVLSPDGNPAKDPYADRKEDTTEPVVTDAQGNFELRGLPAGEVTVVAANEQGAATQRVQSLTVDSEPTAPPLQWKLRPYRQITAPDIERASAILEDVWETSRGSQWQARPSVPSELVATDFEAALTLARGGDDTGPIDPVVLAHLITTLLEADPVRAVEWAPAQLPRLQPEARFGLTVDLGLAAATIQPDLAAQLWADANAYLPKADLPKADLPKAPTPEAGPSRELAMPLLAAFAARLGRMPEAEQMADQAIAWAKNTPNPAEIPRRLGRVAAALAKGNATLSLQALQQIAAVPGKEYEQSDAYWHAIEELAQHDLEGAQQLLEKLGQMAYPRAQYAFSWSALAIIKKLRHTDWRAALALARRVNQEHRAEALLLVAHAASREEVLPILREAVAAVPSTSWNSGVTLALVARLAVQTDAVAGQEMLDKEMLDRVAVRIKALHQNNGPTNGPTDSWRVQQIALTVAAQAAAQTEAAAGPEVLDRAQNKIVILKTALQQSNGGWRVQWGVPTIAAYAMALSGTDPMRSYIMLEEEWAFTRSGQGTLRPALALDHKGAFIREIPPQAMLATAMAAVDLERALEMSWQVQERSTFDIGAIGAKAILGTPVLGTPISDLRPQFEAQRYIARFLLAPSAPLSELWQPF